MTWEWRRSWPSLRRRRGKACAGGVPAWAEIWLTMTVRGAGKPTWEHALAIIASRSPGPFGWASYASGVTVDQWMAPAGYAVHAWGVSPQAGEMPHRPS